MIINKLQNGVLSAAGKYLSFKKLQTAIGSHPERREFLTECTLAFSCDIPYNQTQWRKLRAEFLSYYKSELETIFPGNAFLCRTVSIPDKRQDEFIQHIAKMYSIGLFGKIKLPDMVKLIQQHFDTGYKESTIYNKLKEYK